MKHRLLALLLLCCTIPASAFPGLDEWDKKKKKKKDSDKIAYGLQVGVSYNNYVYGEVGLYKHTPSRFISRTVLAGVEATNIRDSNFFAPKIGFHGQLFKFLRFGSDLLVYTDFKNDLLPILRAHVGASVHGNLFIIVGQNVNFFESHKWSPRIARYQVSLIYRLDVIKRDKKSKKKS